MKNFLVMLGFIGLTMFCWGVYGPTLNMGKKGMEGSTLKPFICVGLAYFAIAVIVPAMMLRMRGEPGHWSTTGIVWSFVAGAVGAVGALGVILAMAWNGNPLYVMPLVFGGAPVVNTFLTMYWSKSFKQLSPWFLAGLIVVITGAVTVLVFRPQTHAAQPHVPVAESPTGEEATPDAVPQHTGITAKEFLMVMLFTAMTAVCWGAYGPTLHRGQTAMAGSRMRPLLCVGLAYFLIAVIVPILILSLYNEPGHFTFSGTVWSLAGGATGALGALGIIMAFNCGGKPIFVMPLVFGGTPVINTFVSIVQTGNYDLHPLFYAGLLLVAAGAVTVLIFSPKPGKHPVAEPEAKPAEQPATT